jgi:hypothetical protein
MLPVHPSCATLACDASARNFVHLLLANELSGISRNSVTEGDLERVDRIFLKKVR